MNRLSKEKSPYLLQHQKNPVDWYPWGEEAFAAARAQKKLIFLSIGYSTCYWCHVMEKDSFEQEEVAAILNRNFISIKVDREEHPDVDEIYMDAVVGLTGRGGWPMTVFLTPGLEPFWGGTFFPKAQFLKILEKLHSVWLNTPEEILSAGKRITEHLQDHDDLSADEKEIFSYAPIEKAVQQLERGFDSLEGGFGNAPKFPPSGSIAVLLRHYFQTKSAQSLLMATTTLDAMACGGIHDHLGGGFHRYSTDEHWLVPHFEKMLYDNALLAMAYLEAYQLTDKKFYADIARNILNYILREMETPAGAYFSAQDAGEVGREGEFYVWTEKELAQVLSLEELAAFRLVYPVEEYGNFEGGTNIFHLKQAQDWEKRQDPLITAVLNKLFRIRSERVFPHKDEKVLTAWNGLMLAAMAKGYQVLREEKYLASAERCAKFIQKNLWRDGKLLRRYVDGDARYSGTLNDYSFFIYGLLHLYEANFSPVWLRWAQSLQERQDELFWDEKNSGYFTSDCHEKNLVTRKKDRTDGAMPSGNSLSANNLLRLYHLGYEERYSARARALLKFLGRELKTIPSGIAYALCALEWLFLPVQEIAVIGEKSDALTQRGLFLLQQKFLPRKVLAYMCPQGSFPALAQGKGLLEGKTAFYVCQDKTCARPVSTLEELVGVLCAQ